MNYLENNLIKGEEIIKKAQFHWMRFVLPAVISIIYIIIPGGLFVVLPIVSYWVIRLLQNEFGVTNKRLLGQTTKGIFSSVAIDQVLKKTEGVAVSVSLMGNLFGYGRVIVTTGGVTHSFNYVKNPYEFKKIVSEQIDITQKD